MAYGLAGFVHELDQLVVEHPGDYRLLIERAERALARLLDDMTWWLDAGLDVPHTTTTQRVLRAHPDGAYVVLSTVFAPGERTEVHDHQMWGVVGVWQGEEGEERFVREDDRSSRDHARLRSLGITANRAGRITVLRPPDDNIHRIVNITGQPACSIHVYGRGAGTPGSQVYDLETGAVRPWGASIGYQELLGRLRQRAGADRFRVDVAP